MKKMKAVLINKNLIIPEKKNKEEKTLLDVRFRKLNISPFIISIVCNK